MTPPNSSLQRDGLAARFRDDMRSDTTHDSEPLLFQALTSLPEISAIASQWDSLVGRSVCNRAFSSSIWYIATCRHYAGMEPYVIIARRGSALAGIMPLVLIDLGRVASFPNYLADYQDIVAEDGDVAVVAGLLNYARSAPNGYTRIELSQLRLDSNCLRALRMMESGNRKADYRETVLCYYVDIPGGYEAFLKTRGSRFRKRLKRLHCLAESTNLAPRELEPESFPAERLPEEFRFLHLQRQPIGSCFEAASGREFLSDVLPELFEKRIVRACALVEGERIVAIDLYTMGHNSLCAWNGGFLPEAERCSPGKLLIDIGIKLAGSLGLSEYDFLRGPEAYKENWATNSRSVGRLDLEVVGH